MPRPSKPLISRAAAVEASIEIIDSDGLDAFSLPKLATYLGVRAPSLYHHFADKNEILAEIARAIAVGAFVKPRRPPGADWPEYFVTLALTFRQSVLRHRNAVPVLVEHLPRDVVADSFEAAARHLSESGVPARLHVQILDGVETICIGTVLVEAMREPGKNSRVPDAGAFPHLAHSVAANDLSTKELLAERIRSFLRGQGIDGRDDAGNR